MEYRKFSVYRPEVALLDGNVAESRLNTVTRIKLDEDRDPVVVDISLHLRGPNLDISCQGEDLSDALFELECELPDGAYLGVCHQCRFGATHPFQGEQWWCLAHIPAVADAIQRDGKYCSEPLDEVQIVEVLPLDTCHRFQRPRVPGRKPGAPRRR